MKDAPTPEQIAESERRWQNATIADDYLFSQIGLYKEIVEQLISLILGIEVELIEEPRVQDSIILDYDVRGIRLDVKCLTDNTVFNIEMQATNNYNLFERERLYRGVQDINQSFKGMAYEQLKESVIIFICTFDPIGRGKPAYIQESYECNFINYKSSGKLYHVPNRAKTLYLSANNYKKEKNILLRNFLSYVMGKKVKGDEFIDMLDNTVRDIKLNPVIKSDYVKFMFKEMEIEQRVRKEEQEKAAKEQEKAIKKLKEEQEKAAKEQEKAAKEQEKAAKEQEKAIKILKEEQEKAAKEQEKAAKEQEKAIKKLIRNLLPTFTPEQIVDVANVSLLLIEEVQTEIENEKN